MTIESTTVDQPGREREIHARLRNAGAIIVVNEPDVGARVEIRFSELRDAQRLHEALINFRAAPAPVAGEQRCVKCGHSSGTTDGFCHVSTQGVFCWCKCVFTPSANLCVWHRPEIESDGPLWWTSCHSQVAANPLRFCPFCGKTVEVSDGPAKEAEGQEQKMIPHKFIPTQLTNAVCAWANHPDAIGDARYCCGKLENDPIHPSSAQSGTEIPEPDAETLIQQWRNTLSEASTVTDEDAEDLLLRVIAYANRNHYRSTADAEKTAREIVDKCIAKVFEPTENATAEGTQMLDGKWLMPLHGCDTLDSLRDRLTDRVASALSSRAAEKVELDPLEFWCDLAEALGHERPVKADIPALVSEVKGMRSSLATKILCTVEEEATHHAQELTERGDEGRDILNYTDFIKGEKTAAQDILRAIRTTCAAEGVEVGNE